MKVYLAGGMRSGWQDIVRAKVPAFTYFDPRDYSGHQEDAYTALDLAKIRNSDMLFAYMEDDNPGGHGMALEIGYAVALGKPVVLVDETPPGSPTHRYIGMVRACAEVVFTSFDDAVTYWVHLSEVTR